MNEITSVNNRQPSRFALTRKNQKGQVAIFVALIFQVIFVFFALLINVGLLVHQKINLQQSVDLAAYYGASKQAENLNAIAHINFQMRQNWKLLTWRYRILGTFGFQKEGASQTYPFESGLGGGLSYNGAANPAAMVCNPFNLGVQDIPFFCVGHSGFKGWSQSESTCRLSCGMFSGAANSIPVIPSPTGITTPLGGNVAGAIQSAVASVNQNTGNLCASLGPVGAALLSRFVLAYSNEATLRSRTIEMLAKNLSLSADKEVDLDGELVFKGAKATLVNNLTEANKTGFMDDQLVVDNGLSKCAFRTGNAFEEKGQREFIKKIEFKFINYFLHNCKVTGGSRDYLPENVYAGNNLSSAFDSLDQKVKDIMLSMLIKDQMHTVGYEKNPHCVEYYAVRAASTPNIPFLPMSKIKLNAVAIAKPFGGTIGPAYGITWPQGSNVSVYSDADVNTRTDKNLPQREIANAGALSDIKISMMLQPNFSLFVGDTAGLRDLNYVAAYHSALAVRDIKNYDGKNFNNINGQNVLGNLGPWPDYANWDGIDNSSMVDLKQYDTLAKLNTGSRALEISAIAPNQFDIYYYSIDPDFFNNYYKRIYKGFAKIHAASGMSSDFIADQVRTDFGAVNPDPNLSAQPVALADERAFSVRDQILIKNQIFNTIPTVTNGGGNPGKRYVDIFDYLITVPSSLLTGWTFLNYSSYSAFPGGTSINRTDKTMTFGRCDDAWNRTTDNDGDKFSPAAFGTPMNTDNKLPPVAGNCVTGGRTGYSVKIVTPDVVRKSDYLVNPVSDFIFNF